MRKLFIILSLVLSLALIISCSPDQLTTAGQVMYKLSDAGLVSRNSKYVDAAADNVKLFIEESEKAFDWPVDMTPTTYDVAVSFRDDAAKASYVSTVDKTVELLLAAKDSSAKDAVLRDALSAKYNGHTNNDNIVTTKNLYDGLKREAFLGAMLTVVEDALSSPEASNMAFVLSMMGLNGVTTDTLGDAIAKIKTTEIPIPLQSYDYDLLVKELFPQIQSIQEAIQTESSASGGDKKNIDLEILRRFQKDIASSVGDRNYQNVGDKIAVGIVYSLLTKIIEINTAYRNNPNYYGACEEGHKYDMFGDFILTEPEGKNKLDGILGCLDAIGYIYGAKIDIAGLIAGLM